MNKKTVICASSKLEREINSWKKKLQENGYQVIQYPKKITGDFLANYQTEFTNHYKKITECGFLFILNADKGDVKGYIGPGVYAEISFAIGFNKTYNRNIKIICLNNIPGSLPYSEELKFWKSLGWIGFWSENKKISA